MRDETYDYLKELRDPVTGETFALAKASPRTLHMNQVYWFASAENQKMFAAEPAKYAIIYR